MPLYSVPRRSIALPQEPKLLVNWRRGLIRVWLLMSAAWIMAWMIYLILKGIQGQIKTTGDFLELPVLLFGPPVALLLFGIAAGWAFRGFRADEPPAGG